MNHRPVFMTLWILAVLMLPLTVSAEIELQPQPPRDLGAQAIDVAVSADGQYIYALTRKHVRVYRASDNQLVAHIPVTGHFDRIAAIGNQELVLTGSSSTQMMRVAVRQIYQIPVDGRPFRGPAEAPVTIVVFSDFQCTYCAGLEPVLRAVLDTYPKQVKVVSMQYPLRSHKYSFVSAQGVLAAREQGKYWEFHDKLFELQKNLNDGMVRGIARMLGLDMERFNTDLKSPMIRAKILNDVAVGQKAGVHGTPAVYINGKVLGNRSFEGFKQAINAELNKEKTEK